jgi:predicted Zn-dependent protease with MMP-like domain
VTREVFDNLVAEAMDRLPEEFREKLENVEVIVENFPDPETIRSLGLRSKWDLLGLYVGVPLTHRSFFSFNTLPERIYLYYQPILREAGRAQDLVEIIRDVVIHEVGHHFGFDDDELETMSRQSE